MPIATPLIALAVCLVAADPGAGAEPAQVIVSKETTYLDGPLHKDGTVDYVAALDKLSSEGVTQGNNAAPLLWRAVGTRWAPDKTITEAAAKRLKMDAPSPDAMCLTSLADLFFAANPTLPLRALFDPPRNPPPHAATVLAMLTPEDHALLKRPLFKDARGALNEASRAKERATSIPWKAKDQPVIALWLRINEKPLALIEEASHKPHYHWPREGGVKSSMFDLLTPSFDSLSAARDLLACRAMLRIESGDLKGAWSDAMTGYRLARLLAAETTFGSHLGAIAFDESFHVVTLLLLTSDKISGPQITAMSTDFEKLGPASDMRKAMDTVERCFMLDSIGFVRRRGVESITRITGDDIVTEASAARHAAEMNDAFDARSALKRINERIDVLVAGWGKPTFHERHAAVEAERERIEKLRRGGAKSSAADLTGKLFRTAASRRKTGEQFGDQMLVTLMPAIASLMRAEEQDLMRRDLFRVIFALEAHRAEKGAYPKELSELSPKYLAKLPVDRFDGKPLRYVRKGNGFLLYSIGADERDDGGEALADVSLRVLVEE